MRRDDRSSEASRWCYVGSLLWALLAVGGPLLIVLGISLSTRETYGWIRWDFSLANYRDLLHPLYFTIVWRSCVLAAAVTGICLLIGFPFAYLIARSSARWQSFWLVMVLIPLWANFLVRTYAWILILRTDGLLNTWLTKWGLTSEPMTLLYTPSAVVLGLVYGYLPFMILPIYSSLEQVNPVLEEAARDLYASRWQVLLRVLVPLSLPGIIAGSVLVFVASLGAYLTPDLLGGARTMMMGNLLQHEFLVVRDWPLGSAFSMVLLVLVLLALWAFRRVTTGTGPQEVLR
ncbi:MAG: ABC transporter permease [Nitrospiraceae bacterium]